MKYLNFKKKKFYAPDILHNMFLGDKYLAYFNFLHTVLEKVQLDNKSYESNTVKSSKQLNNLFNPVNSITKQFIILHCRQNALTCNVNIYVTPNVILCNFEYLQFLKFLPKRLQ